MYDGLSAEVYYEYSKEKRSKMTDNRIYKKKAQAMRQSYTTIYDCHRNNICVICAMAMFVWCMLLKKSDPKNLWIFMEVRKRWLLVTAAVRADNRCFLVIFILHGFVLRDVYYMIYTHCIRYVIVYSLNATTHKVQMISKHKQLRRLCNPTFSQRLCLYQSYSYALIAPKASQWCEWCG